MKISKQTNKVSPKHKTKGKKFQTGAYLRRGNAFSRYFHNFKKSYHPLIIIMNFLNSAFPCNFLSLNKRLLLKQLKDNGKIILLSEDSSFPKYSFLIDFKHPCFYSVWIHIHTHTHREIHDSHFSLSPKLIIIIFCGWIISFLNGVQFVYKTVHNIKKRRLKSKLGPPASVMCSLSVRHLPINMCSLGFCWGSSPSSNLAMYFVEISLGTWSSDYVCYFTFQRTLPHYLLVSGITSNGQDMETT